jgi:hypothetical protein
MFMTCFEKCISSLKSAMEKEARLGEAFLKEIEDLGM